MTLQLYDNQDVHAYNTHCATYTVCLCWDLRRTTTSTYNLYPTLRDTRVKFDFLLKGHAHFRIHITPLISRSFGIPCAVENLWSYTSVISDLHCQGSCGCCFSSDEFHLRVISAITYSVSSSLVDDFWHRAWPALPINVISCTHLFVYNKLVFSFVYKEMNRHVSLPSIGP